jgi:hypothetical protein
VKGDDSELKLFLLVRATDRVLVFYVNDFTNMLRDNLLGFKGT